jgi:hypothetical protein
MLTCGKEFLPSSTLLAKLDCRLHLGKLKLYKRVFSIPISVILGKNFEGFLISASRHKPARRLWKQEDQEDLNERRGCLQQTWQSPGPIRVDVERTERDPCISSSATFSLARSKLQDITYSLRGKRQSSIGCFVCVSTGNVLWRLLA